LVSGEHDDRGSRAPSTRLPSCPAPVWARLTKGSSLVLPSFLPFQWISRLRISYFFTKNYSKYIKIVDTKLAPLESIFHYESNDTNYVQYNQDFVAQFLGQSMS
jgi:hypothetical protein